MNEQELAEQAVDKRLRDAIIYKSDKNQEMRILVIYYIEKRTRYFNAFADNIYAILTNINILYETENREIRNISAIARQQTQWNKNIPKKLLGILIEQADRNKTSSINVINYLYTVPPDTTIRHANIAQSEKRIGLFPDDGLFEMFKQLTNKDIRAKIIAENERITSFLQIIQKILFDDKIRDDKKRDDINKYIVSLSERFETKRTYSSRLGSLSSLFSLRSKKIAPKPIVSSVSSTSQSDEHAIDKKAPLLTQMFAYSQSDLIQFLTITDSVLKRLDIVMIDINIGANEIINIQNIVSTLLGIRSEYIDKMRRLHDINHFNPKITTHPSSILSEYKGGRKNKKPNTKPIKKPKPTRRIRLRFP